MAGYAVDPRLSPYFRPQDAGSGSATIGNGNGMGWMQGLEALPGASAYMGENGINPDALYAFLQQQGYQLNEQGLDGSAVERWITDANGADVGARESFSLEDNNFWTAALLSGALVGGATAAWAGGGAGGGLAAAGTEAGIGAIPEVAGANLATVGGAGGQLGTVGAGGAGLTGGGGLLTGGAGATTGATGFGGVSANAFAGAGGGMGGFGGLTGSQLLAGGQTAVGLIGNYQQGKAQQEAAQAQQQAAQAGQAQQMDMFRQMQAGLAPYTGAGVEAIGGQRDLIGLGGPQAQQAAIDAIQAGPQFQSMQRMGENRILANASASGGLRGGNIQEALSQFSPQLLSSLMDQQYNRLGGLAQLGQASAAGVGSAGIATGQGVAGLMQRGGAAAAGGALSRGATNAGYWGTLSQGLGLYAGLQGGW